MAQPNLVKYAPPSQSTPIGTTFVDFDSLTPKITPVGLDRAVLTRPPRPLKNSKCTSRRSGRECLARPPPPPVGGDAPPQGRRAECVDQRPEAPRRARRPDFLRFARRSQCDGRRQAGHVLRHQLLRGPRSHRPGPGGRRAGGAGHAPHLRDRLRQLCRRHPRRPGSAARLSTPRTLTFLRLESHITTLNAGESTLHQHARPGRRAFCRPNRA